MNRVFTFSKKHKNGWISYRIPGIPGAVFIEANKMLTPEGQENFPQTLELPEGFLLREPNATATAASAEKAAKAKEREEARAAKALAAKEKADARLAKLQEKAAAAKAKAEAALAKAQTPATEAPSAE